MVFTTTLIQAAIFINRVALAKQGDNVLGSVRLSVHGYGVLRVPESLHYCHMPPTQGLQVTVA